tara:strand:- start:153 stop:785 length:633 start_codon:yes stop_codon:yes gene_type:complete
MGRLKKLNHRIISIKPQRSKNRFNITLESGDVFGISEDVLVSSKLSEGKYVSNKELDRIINDEVHQKIKDKVLHLLSFRARSRFELYTRLTRKGFDKSKISNVIDELEEKGYLDDKEFSKTYASHLIRSKCLGRIAVEYQFKKHQIPSDILDPILDELYIEYPIEELIKRIILKKEHKLSPELIKDKKLIDRIKRKGYSWGEITSVISSF